jgi:hypothetical protein
MNGFHTTESSNSWIIICRYSKNFKMSIRNSVQRGEKEGLLQRRKHLVCNRKMLK